ncbi:EGF-like domain-containing protein [Aphelenchoides besseyi]|nr:EGF-like domain-containing protein [Aphelenchoides besseyi]
MLSVVINIVLCLLFLCLSVTSLTDQSTKSSSLCYNGKRDARGVCICDQGYTGRLCERKMNCAGYERQSNMSCIACKSGWVGSDCDYIDCGHNGVATSPTECKCDKPWSGATCRALDTKDVYLFYNQAMYSYGPLGIVLLIPLICVWFGCRKFAHARQVERTEKAIEDQYKTDVSSDLVEVLLKK